MDKNKVKKLIGIYRYRNIPVTMLCLFKALYEAGRNYQTAPQLLFTIWGRNDLPFSKLGFGGLGYRIQQIDPANEGILELVEIEKDENENCWLYRFHNEAIEAINQTLILKEVINSHSYNRIRAKGPYPFIWQE